MADRKAMLRLVIEAVAVHPIEVHERLTSVRVQWHSGVVSELQIARPGRGKQYAHDPKVIDRIRQLAAASKHDEEIAQQLNTTAAKSNDDAQIGCGSNSWIISIGWLVV